MTLRRGFPLDDARDTIHPTQGVDVPHEVAGTAVQGAVEFDLEVPSCILDLDPLIGPKAKQELLPLLLHLFPVVAVSVFQRCRLETRPLEREERNGIYPEEVRFHDPS